MPAVFRCPTQPAGSKNASYFAVVGPETIFAGKKGTGFAQITDGTSNTILLVEAKRDIPWTKPEDIPYDANQPPPKLGGHFQGRFGVALADGSARLLPSAIGDKVLRASDEGWPRGSRNPQSVGEHEDPAGDHETCRLRILAFWVLLLPAPRSPRHRPLTSHGSASR